MFQVSLYRAVLRGGGLLLRRTPLAESAGVRRSLSRQLGSRAGRTERSCTVDPNLEEQFEFVDWTDVETDGEPTLQEETSLPSLPPPVRPQTHLRSLERQLQVLKGVGQRKAEPESLIEFHDVDFPLDQSLITAKKKKKQKQKGAGPGEHRVVGTPDVDEPFSDTCCSGCGAILHCTAPAVPGYLPSEKYKVLLQEEKLGQATCQRCYLLTHYRQALDLHLSSDEYKRVVQRLRPLRALILLIVDLTDIPASIVPDLPGLVGTNKHIVVLGNKVDLLPEDSPNYLQRIKRQLSHYCDGAGFGPQVTDVHLISAKTGYGVETLISSLQSSWKYKGDVYLVGQANAGKSTLFNTLLESDYCKSKSSDLIHKATISPWPGTTLNLLKFPIINPTPYRMFKRQERLREESQQTEDELTEDELKRLKVLSHQGYLVGRVGRTFRSNDGARRAEIEFDPDSLAFGDKEDGEMTTAEPSRTPREFTYNELKDAHWLYDTPGILRDRDILLLLSEQEVMSVVPSRALVPRTFVLKPGWSLLVGGLGRIDFMEGGRSCWFSVLVSSRVPIHITSLEKVDQIYEKHAGGVLLGVPMGGPERMKTFPPLVPQEVRLEGRGYLEASADITLSSAGWVAVTAAEGEQLLLRVHGPEEAGFGVRTPPLLPRVVALKGERIKKSAAYKVIKPTGLIDSGLSTHGVKSLQVMNKKKRKKKKKD
ncbi:nitric oxide-associated protein 1-like [Cheilinus undulatus]|uniref:nitric oxide-associated protein 1-like n=1 Tax=Cheilinus undulatus TaxID=241271 RepID=UPI001BD4EEF9|nr:nitric oxide-associated protein 1-like [Cheilinus undulatus]